MVLRGKASFGSYSGGKNKVPVGFRYLVLGEIWKHNRNCCARKDERICHRTCQEDRGMGYTITGHRGAAQVVLDGFQEFNNSLHKMGSARVPFS
jgi:hypothetical protein